VATRCATRYPTRRVTWKKAIAVFQTEGDPPRTGSRALAAIGSMTNKRRAATNPAAAYSPTTVDPFLIRPSLSAQMMLNRIVAD
jgi:hypothetical protein